MTVAGSDPRSSSPALTNPRWRALALTGPSCRLLALAGPCWPLRALLCASRPSAHTRQPLSRVDLGPRDLNRALKTVRAKLAGVSG